MTVSEMLRLACIYAERDQLEFVRCVKESDPDVAAETLKFVERLRAYRLKRWGKTKLEKAMDKATAVNVMIPNPADAIRRTP